MNLFTMILAADTATMSGGSWFSLLLPIICIIPIFYFLIYRPQKKQQRQQDELMNSLEIGDSVCTTAGFYGVVIDKVDENVIIVEFGNNKNCRIPVKKTSITEVEKSNSETK